MKWHRRCCAPKVHMSHRRCDAPKVRFRHRRCRSRATPKVSHLCHECSKGSATAVALSPKAWADWSGTECTVHASPGGFYLVLQGRMCHLRTPKSRGDSSAYRVALIDVLIITFAFIRTLVQVVICGDRFFHYLSQRFLGLRRR